MPPHFNKVQGHFSFFVRSKIKNPLFACFCHILIHGIVADTIEDILQQLFCTFGDVLCCLQIIFAMIDCQVKCSIIRCSLPRKTQKTDTQNEKNAPEHHVQERFLLPINGVLPLFYPFNFSSILATCRKICLSVSLLLVSFSVSSFGLSVVVVAFFANPFSPAALMIAG